jgi:4a-hydroxytetrahydrobiopterin dehydratase
MQDSYVSERFENPMAQLLSDAEVQERMSQLNGWTVAGKTIQQTYKFKDFVEAIAFVNQLVEPAEAAGHHPDIAISYNRVTVSLSTHDAGGLTEKDFALAQQISQLISS